MSPVETVPGVGRRWIKDDGGSEFNYNIFDIL
jgi:hypothetical protein